MQEAAEKSRKRVSREPYSVRLAPAERRVLEVAALQRGVTVAEFVRTTSVQTARAEIAGQPS